VSRSQLPYLKSVISQRHKIFVSWAKDTMSGVQELILPKKKYKLCVLNVLGCQARRLYFCVKQDLRTETFFWRFRTEIVWCCTSLLAAGMVFISHVQICNGYFSSGLANLIGIISNGQARGSLCSLLYERSQQTKLHIRSDQAFKQCWKECRFTGK
jgi:hypothetical protein